MRRAFTLIELLVGIAIIAILAAVLFPVFATARAKARQAACLSNFKQLIAATLQYAQDYDDLYPLANTDFDFARTTLAQQLIQPYLKNDRILACPGDPATEEERIQGILFRPARDAAERARAWAWTSNWGINWQYFGPRCGGRAFSVGVYQVAAPADTLYAVDSILARLPGRTFGGFFAVDPPCRNDASGADTFAPCTGGRSSVGPGWRPGAPTLATAMGRAWAWHGEFATAAFADGHVKALPVRRLAGGCDVRDNWRGPIRDRSIYLWDLE